MKTPLAVFAVALILRLATLVRQWNAPIDMDGAEYVRLAENIIHGFGYVGMRGVPTTEFPPVFPGLIAAVASVPLVRGDVAAAVISVVAGAALPALVYLLARELYGRGVALVAALFAAVVPLWIMVSTTILSEATYAALVALGLWLLVRAIRLRRNVEALAAGGTFALAALTRPDGLVLCAFGVLALAVAGIRVAALRRLAVLSAAASVATLLPYVLFLYSSTGHVGLESKSALNFTLARSLRTSTSYLSAADNVDATGHPVGVEVDPRWYDARVATPPGPPLHERLSLAAGALVKHVRDVAMVLGGRDAGLGLLVVLAFAGLIMSPWDTARRRDELIMIAAAVALYLPLAAVWHFWERFVYILLIPLIVWAAKGTYELSIWSRASRVPNLGVALAGLFIVASLALDASNAAHVPGPAAERTAGRWLNEHGHSLHVVDVSDRTAYYAGASWSPLPYGSTSAVTRYLDRLRPDVVVIDTRHARDYPLIASWFESNNLPQGRLMYTVPSDTGGELRLYSWDPARTSAR